MDIYHFRTFHRVAVSGSFTKAAQSLFLTQPAVSMQIQTLETFLKVTLFDRSRRQIRLTREGEILFDYTQRIFGLFDEVQNVFQDLSQLQVGRLSIGATSVMGTYYLTNFISRFNEQFPRIDLEIRIGNSQLIAELVAEGEIELGFAGRSFIPPQLQQVFLHREQYTMVVGPDSPLAGRAQSTTPHELINMPFIMREKGTRIRSKISNWLKKHTGRDTPQNMVTLSSMEASKRLVASGYGVTALPHLAVSREIDNGQLIPLTVKHFELGVDYYLLYHGKKNLPHAASSFLSLLHADATGHTWPGLPESLIRP